METDPSLWPAFLNQLILDRVLESQRNLAGVVVPAQLSKPKIKAVKIAIGRVVRIAMQVTKVMQQEKRSIIFLFDKSWIVANLKQSTGPILSMIHQVIYQRCSFGRIDFDSGIRHELVHKFHVG